MCFVDGLIGKGRGSGVGVSDGYLAEALPAENVRTLFRWQIGIGECVVGVGVAERPAVHGNGEDIVRGAETGRSKHTVKLIANLEFELTKSHRQQFALAGTILFLAWE